jgi:hypothetical protein
MAVQRQKVHFKNLLELTGMPKPEAKRASESTGSVTLEDCR